MSLDMDILSHPAWNHLRRGKTQVQWANAYLAAGQSDPEYTDRESIQIMCNELQSFLLREIKYRTYCPYPDHQRLSERGQMPPTDEELAYALGRYAGYTEYLDKTDETAEEFISRNWYANYD